MLMEININFQYKNIILPSISGGQIILFGLFLQTQHIKEVVQKLTTIRRSLRNIANSWNDFIFII